MSGLNPNIRILGDSQPDELGDMDVTIESDGEDQADIPEINQVAPMGIFFLLTPPSL